MRQFLKDRLDYEKLWDYPKSIEETTGDSAGGITTNWATFYHEVKVSGYKQILHLPVISSLTRNISGMQVCPNMAQIILKTNENELVCLMVCGVEEVTKEKILEHRFIEGEIMKYHIDL